jgi:cytoskeletal protein RodZ
MRTAKPNGQSGESSRTGSSRDDTAREGAGGRERTSRLLREARERRSLSLGEVAQHTHIPLPTLYLLEGSGTEQAVPDPLYLIAPLRAYAAFLQLELGSVLTDFMMEVEQLPVAAEQAGRGPRLLPSLRAFPERPAAVAPGTLLLLLTLGSLAVVGRYSGQTWALRPTAHREAPLSPASGPPRAPEAGTPQAAASPDLFSAPAEAQPSEPPAVAPAGSPPLTAALQSTPAVAAVPGVEAPVVHAPLPSPPSPESAPHRLRVRAHAKTWLQLTVDGHPLRRVILAPGQAQEWAAKQGFTLSVGNAGAVKLSLDGHALPPVGRAGQSALNVHLPAPSKNPEQEVRNAGRPRGPKPR